MEVSPNPQLLHKPLPAYQTKYMPIFIPNQIYSNIYTKPNIFQYSYQTKYIPIFIPNQIYSNIYTKPNIFQLYYTKPNSYNKQMPFSHKYLTILNSITNFNKDLLYLISCSWPPTWVNCLPPYTLLLFYFSILPNIHLHHSACFIIPLQLLKGLWIIDFRYILKLNISGLHWRKNCTKVH